MASSPKSPLPQLQLAPSAVMWRGCVQSSRHGNDALPNQSLDLLRLQLVLLISVAHLAMVSVAPAQDSAVGGAGEAVLVTSRDSNDALLR